MLPLFFFYRSRAHRDLHSFPTRRSSDLPIARIGALVARGDMIGIAGCTGFCMGTHLHFELREHGHAVDPMSLFPDRKSTRLNSSHEWISYAVFCLKKKTKTKKQTPTDKD